MLRFGLDHPRHGDPAAVFDILHFAQSAERPASQKLIAKHAPRQIVEKIGIGRGGRSAVTLTGQRVEKRAQPSNKVEPLRIVQVLRKVERDWCFSPAPASQWRIAFRSFGHERPAENPV